MASIQKDILELLIKNREELGLPEFIQMDFLPPLEDAISLQSDSMPKVEKAYIGGDRICTYPFTILASTKGNKSSAPNLKAIDWLDAISALFEGMSNYRLSDKRVIISGEAMTPALVNRHSNGHLVYSNSITIIYEEHK